MKPRSKFVPILLALNLLMVGGVAWRYLAPKPRADAKVLEYHSRTSEGYAERGFMTKADYARLTDLQSQASESHAISSADLSWSIAQVERTLNDPSRKAATFRSDVMFLWGLLKDIDDSQRATLFQSLKRVMAAPDDTPENLNAAFSIELMAKLRMKDAVPTILPALRHPNAEVRQSAAAALKRLGYDAPVQS